MRSGIVIFLLFSAVLSLCARTAPDDRRNTKGWFLSNNYEPNQLKHKIISSSNIKAECNPVKSFIQKSSTSDSVVIEWEHPDGSTVNGYFIKVGGLPLENEIPPFQTTYTIQQLTTCEKKDVEIVVDCSDPAALSKPTSITIVAVNHVANLKQETTTESEALISWGKSDAACVTGYQIKYDTTDIPVGKDVTSYTITELTACLPTDVMVSLVLETGDQAGSSSLAVFGSSGPVQNLKQKSLEVDGTVIVGWEAPENSNCITGYQIYKNGEAIGSLTDLSNFEFEISGLTSCQKAEVKVVPLHEEVLMEEATVNVFGSIGPVANLKQETTTESEALITWDKSDAACVTGYHIKYDTTDDSVVSDVTSYTVTGLTACLPTTVTVSLILEDVHQAGSSLLDVFGSSGPVQNLKQKSLEADGKVIVSWDAPENPGCITGYQIYKDGVEGGPPIDLSTLEYEIIDLTTCQKLQVKVVPLYNNILMEEATINVFGSIEPVQNLRQETATESGVLISWTKSEATCVTGYNIKYDSTDVPVGIDVTSYNLTGLTSCLPTTVTVSLILTEGDQAGSSSLDVFGSSGPVQNLKQKGVDAYGNVIVSWDAPENIKCITSYKIYKDEGEAGQSTDLSSLEFKISGLTGPCQNAIVKVVPLHNEMEMEEATTEVFGSIGAVTVKQDSATGTDAKIVWSLPANIPDDCVTGYKITHDGKPLVDPGPVNELHLVNLSPPCRSVPVKITPQHNGIDAGTTQLINVFAGSGQVQYLTYTPNEVDDSGSISWRAPTVSSCVTGYRVKIGNERPHDLEATEFTYLIPNLGTGLEIPVQVMPLISEDLIQSDKNEIMVGGRNGADQLKHKIISSSDIKAECNPVKSFIQKSSTSDSVVIEWEHPDGSTVKGYFIKVGGLPVENELPQSQTTYTIPQLTTCEKKNVEIIVDCSDTQNMSKPISISIIPVNHVANLKQETTTESEALISWDTSDDACVTGYQIKYDTTDIPVGKDVTSYTITELTACLPTDVMVSLVLETGDQAGSSSLAVFGSSGPVQNLKQKSLEEDGTVIVSWEAPENFDCITGYQIYQDEVPIGPLPDLSNLEFKISGLTSCQKAEVRVVPLHEEMLMEEATINVFGSIGPVQNLRQETTIETNALIAWDKSDAACVTGYQIKYDTIDVSVGKDVTSYTVTELTACLPTDVTVSLVLETGDQVGSSSLDVFGSSGPVQNLKQKSVEADGKIIVSWESPENPSCITGYQIYKDGEAEPPIDLSTLEYEIIDITTCQKVQVKVVPLHEKVLMEEATINVFGNIEPVANLKQETTTESEALITWDKSDATCVTGYQIKYDTTDVPVGKDVTSYTVTGLTACLPTTVTVSLVLEEVDQVGSSLLDVFGSSGPVQNLKQKSLEADGKIIVSWESPENPGCITGYQIYKDGEALPPIDLSTLEYEIIDITTCQKVQVKVVPLHEKVLMEEATINVFGNIEPVANLKQETTTESEALITWDKYDAACVSGYQIKYDTTDVSVGKDVTSYTVTGLTACLPTTVTVSLILTEDDQAGSSSLDVFGSSGPVKNLKQKSVEADGKVIVSWEAPENNSCITGYQIYKDGEAEPPIDLSTLEYEIIDIATCQKVEVKVVPLHDKVLMEEATINVFGNIEPVVNLKQETTTESEALITWDKSDAACVTGYQIKYDTTDVPVGKDVTSYTVTGLTACLPTTVTVSLILEEVDQVGRSSLDVLGSSGPVKNLKQKSVEADGKVIVSWEAPENLDCITGYQIYKDGEAEPPIDLSTLEYEIIDIATCQKVEVKVVPLHDKVLMEEATINVFGNIEPVANLKQETATESEALITWDKFDAACVTGYQIKYESTDVPVGKDVTSYNVTGLTACFSTTVTVSLILEDVHQAGSSSLEVFGTSGPVKDVIQKSATGTEAVIAWAVPAGDSSCVTGYKVVKGTTEIVQTSNTMFTATISSLIPCKNYSEYSVIPICGQQQGPETPVTFETLPSQVTLETNSTSTLIELNIILPTECDLVISSYHITVSDPKPPRPVPSGCPVPDGKDVPEYQDTHFEFSPAFPGYRYPVSVSANSRFGEGEAIQKEVDTEPTDSDKPRDVSVVVSSDITETEYKVSTEIQWKYPCNTNGDDVSTFGLKVSAMSPENTESVIYSENIAANNVEQVYSVTLDSIQPSFTYTYNIMAGQTTTTDKFKSPGWIPPTVPNTSPTANVQSPTTVKFTLKKNLFSNTQGDILYYAVIVSTAQLIESFGVWNDGDDSTWPPSHFPIKSAVKTYQATPKRWNPFKATEQEATIVIGEATSCQSGTEFCNGPLEPNTEYYVCVRGLTSNGYRDSKAVYFKTSSVSPAVEDDVDLGMILGIVFGILGAALIAGFIFILWRRKKRQPHKPHGKSHFDDFQMMPVPVSVKQFPYHYQDMKANMSRLKTEFNMIESKSAEEAGTCSVASLARNKKRNRYVNILPFDHTRVVLEDEQEYADYINASYIKGYSGNVEYIASQGPLPHTCADFWKMVLQERIHIIVMLTQFHEQGKEKCHRYFPRNHENMEVGEDIEIRCMNELDFGWYCVRTLLVQHDMTKLTITHLQFLDWPDFGCPSGTNNMLEFLRLMRQHIHKGSNRASLIHCSAGVGRTGTIIALDILLQAIKNNKDVDIFGTVFKLRKQRSKMVQTDKQYMYIHECITDYIQNPYTTADIRRDVNPIYENIYHNHY